MLRHYPGKTEAEVSFVLICITLEYDKIECVDIRISFIKNVNIRIYFIWRVERGMKGYLEEAAVFPEGEPKPTFNKQNIQDN